MSTIHERAVEHKNKNERDDGQEIHISDVKTDKSKVKERSKHAVHMAEDIIELLLNNVASVIEYGRI